MPSVEAFVTGSLFIFPWRCRAAMDPSRRHYCSLACSLAPTHHAYKAPRCHHSSDVEVPTPTPGWLLPLALSGLIETPKSIFISFEIARGKNGISKLMETFYYIILANRFYQCSCES